MPELAGTLTGRFRAPCSPSREEEEATTAKTRGDQKNAEKPMKYKVAAKDLVRLCGREPRNHQRPSQPAYAGLSLFELGGHALELVQRNFAGTLDLVGDRRLWSREWSSKLAAK